MAGAAWGATRAAPGGRLLAMGRGGPHHGSVMAGAAWGKGRAVAGGRRSAMGRGGSYQCCRWQTPQGRARSWPMPLGPGACGRLTRGITAQRNAGGSTVDCGRLTQSMTVQRGEGVGAHARSHTPPPPPRHTTTARCCRKLLHQVTPRPGSNLVTLPTCMVPYHLALPQSMLLQSWCVRRAYIVRLCVMQQLNS